MQRFRMTELALAVLGMSFAAVPALAQTWAAIEAADDGGARASICPVGEEGSDDFVCFRLECTALEPLHFTLDVAGRDAVGDGLAVAVGVDGGDVGVLNFTPVEAAGSTRLTAPFDPRIHEDMVDLLQRGLRASLTLDWPSGPEEVPMGLTGSSDSLFTVLNTCPRPALPVDDPGSLVLEEVVAACDDLGGIVTLEPGFERREDLDGDGREDLVIDYAAAACSESATLNCGTGGCTVGFYLARDDGFTRMFADVVRGYEVVPGGFLALDLNGSDCGLYGFEACRKVFDIAGDAPVLVEEIGGPDAETMALASADAAETEAEAEPEAAPVAAAVTEATEAEPETGTEPAPLVVAATEGADVETDTTAAVADVPEEAPDTTAVEAVAEAEPVAEPATEAAAEDDTLTIAAVTPEASPVEPTPSSTATEAGTDAAMAASESDDDGPTSRHDAGPAPAVPLTAEWRGDGTLILPEVVLQ